MMNDTIPSIRWLDIPGYEDSYQISDTGCVRRKSASGNRPAFFQLKPSPNRDGYLYVRLTVKKVQRRFALHRLVMLAFVGDSNLDVNHINGVKHDNHLENLEYLTRQQNIHHARDVLNVVGGNRHTAQSMPRTFKKLREADVRGIRELHKSGLSQKEIAQTYNISIASICRIINRTAWSEIE